MILVSQFWSVCFCLFQQTGLVWTQQSSTRAEAPWTQKTSKCLRRQNCDVNSRISSLYWTRGKDDAVIRLEFYSQILPVGIRETFCHVPSVEYIKKFGSEKQTNWKPFSSISCLMDDLDVHPGRMCVHIIWSHDRLPSTANLKSDVFRS